MIKLIQKLISNPLLMLSLSILLVSTSCERSNTIPITTNFTGQELFRGIFFGQTDVANRIPNITKSTGIEDLLSTEEASAINGIRDLLVEEIEQIRPNFFMSFKDKIQSGEHLKIEEGLIEAGEVISNAALSLSGWSEDQLNAAALKYAEKYGDLTDESGTIVKSKVNQMISEIKNDHNGNSREQYLLVIVVVALALAVAVNFAGILNYAAVVHAVKVDVSSEINRANNQRFLIDELINSIAKNLKVGRDK